MLPCITLPGGSSIPPEMELFEFIPLVGEMGGARVVLTGRVSASFKAGEVKSINTWFVVVSDDIPMPFIPLTTA